jgi:hypothetical protein
MVVVLLDNGSDASQEMDDSGNSPSGSVGNASRRKYCKKKFMRSEIKTRGAILPRFASKIEAGHLTMANSEDASYVSTRSSSSIPRYSICIGARYNYL